MLLKSLSQKLILDGFRNPAESRAVLRAVIFCQVVQLILCDCYVYMHIEVDGHECGIGHRRPPMLGRQEMLTVISYSTYYYCVANCLQGTESQ